MVSSDNNILQTSAADLTNVIQIEAFHLCSCTGNVMQFCEQQLQCKATTHRM